MKIVTEYVPIYYTLCVECCILPANVFVARVDQATHISRYRIYLISSISERALEICVPCSTLATKHLLEECNIIRRGKSTFHFISYTVIYRSYTSQNMHNSVRNAFVVYSLNFIVEVYPVLENPIIHFWRTRFPETRNGISSFQFGTNTSTNKMLYLYNITFKYIFYRSFAVPFSII